MKIEQRARAQRVRDGIPLPADTWSELQGLKEEHEHEPIHTRRTTPSPDPRNLRVVAGATVGTALEVVRLLHAAVVGWAR